MRLSSFIHDTLYEIALGVQIAQARAKDLIAINPSRLDGVDVTERSYVDFDVSIVVGEDAGSEASGAGKAGGEIKVASIFTASLGAEGEKKSTSSKSTEQTHRVAFKVPVYMGASYATNPAAAEAAAVILAKHAPIASG